MKKDYILFIDSGVGGLSTLAETYQKLPANYLYFADNKNSPYGNHSANEIFEYLKEIINSLRLTYNIKIIVLACNTATTSAIKSLRNHFSSIKFIGTEPALKVAKNKGFKNIFCVSTPATLKQPKFISLKEAINENIIEYPAKMLASCIEKYHLHPSIATFYNLKKELYKIALKSKKCDSIVLGCTHYVLVKTDILSITNKPVFDGNVGVSNQVIFWHNKLAKKPNKSSVKFFVSNTQIAPKEIYKKIFNEILAKVQKL